MRMWGWRAVVTALLGVAFIPWVFRQKGLAEREGQPYLTWVERLSYDLPFSLRLSSTQSFEHEITFIEITPTDYEDLGGFKGGIARTNISAALARLQELHPRLVFVDLLLTRTNNYVEDVALADQIGRTAALLLVGSCISDREALAPIFMERSAHTGCDNVNDRPDRTVRLMPGVFSTNTSGKASGVAASWRAAEMVGASITTNGSPKSPRYINYYGPGRLAVKHIGFKTALSLPKEELSASVEGRYVFIGDSRGAQGDRFRNPCDGCDIPGLDLQATAFVNLLRGDFLTHLPILIQAWLIVVWGVGVTFVANRARWRPWGVVLASVVVVALSVILQLGWQIWWVWMIPVIQALVAMVWACLPIKHLVFISYRRSDGNLNAKALQKSLETLKIKAFLDDSEIQPGDYFPERLKREIKRSGILILVLTPGALEALPKCHSSPVEPEAWVAREVRLAIDNGLRIIVVRAGTDSLTQGSLQEPFSALEGLSSIEFEKGTGFDHMLWRICQGASLTKEVPP